MSNIQNVRKSIQNGEMEDAIQAFLNLTQDRYPKLHNELIHVSSRFHALERNIRNYTISHEQAEISKAKISSALIQLARQFEEKSKDPPNGHEKKKGGPDVDPDKSDPDSTDKTHKKILFLSANPKDSSRLRIDEEVRKIEEGLLRAKHRDQFELISKWAVQVGDLQRHFLDESPNLVHFSGHGSKEGLILETLNGQSQIVDPEALGDLFSLFSDTVECVVLNACYSEAQAQAINAHIDYVIGMDDAIPDEAAIAFAISFYDALGAGRNIDFAYKLGCNSIKLFGIKGDLIPKLKMKIEQ